MWKDNLCCYLEELFFLAKELVQFRMQDDHELLRPVLCTDSLKTSLFQQTSIPLGKEDMKEEVDTGNALCKGACNLYTLLCA